MTVPIWQADDTQPIREVDFLVVGAGLAGCAAAYFAQQAGRQVTITDMRDVALGASSRNAGFMITGLDVYYHHSIERYGHDTALEMWQLSAHTHQFWREIAKQDGNVRMWGCGSVLLAESAEEAKDLEQAARALQADGIEVEYHSSDPFGRGFFAGIRQPLDGAVHPVDLTYALLRASGAELIANNELYAIKQESPHEVMVYTRQYRFKARYVMLCTNAYSIHIDPYFIGKIIPTRAQCLVTAPLKDPSIFDTCGYSDYGYMYYRTTFDGRLLIGGGRKQNKALENDTTDDRVTDPVQRILDAYLRDKFPDVDVPVERRWSGIMGFTPDGLPMVGTLPGRPNVGFAVGFNGHGLALGAGTVERAVDMLLNGADPGVLSAKRLE